MISIAQYARSRMIRQAIAMALVLLSIFNGVSFAKEEIREPYWVWYLGVRAEWGDFDDPEQVRELYNQNQEQKYQECLTGNCRSCMKYIVGPVTKANALSSFYNGKLTVIGNDGGERTNWSSQCNGEQPVNPPSVTPLTGWISVHSKRLCPPGYSQRTTRPIPANVTIDGWSMPSYNSVCFKDIPDPPKCPPNKVADPQCGNPVDAMGGAKIQVETDYESSDGLLRVKRSYSSELGRWIWNHDAAVLDFSGRGASRPAFTDLVANIKMMPPGVRDSYVPSLNVAKTFPLARTNPSQTTSEVWVSSSSGRRLYFTEPTAGSFSTLAPEKPQLTVSGVAGSHQWALRSPDQAIGLQLFNATGELSEQWTADGKRITYQRESDLLTVTAWPGGRKLVYSRSDPDLIAGAYDTVTLPGSNELQYEINDQGMVAQVTHADASTKGYLYNESAHASPPAANQGTWNRLTGLIDEDGVRLGTYAYDGNVPVSTELAGGVNKFTFVQYANRNEVLTPPHNAKEIFRWSIGPDGEKRMAARNIPAGAGSAAGTTSFAYDASGNIASVTDYRGYRTCYSNDPSRGVEVARLEGMAGSCPSNVVTHVIPTNTRQRKVSTQWHPVWNLRVAEAEPKRITTWVYNGQVDPQTGNPATCVVGAPALPDGTPIAVICKRIEQATSDETGTNAFSAVAVGAPRTWTYSYNSYGQALAVDGPRDDAADTTTFTYYDCDTGYECGQVRTITNALGHETTYNSYNAHGQPLTITDANGVTTTLSYDLRQRLTSRTVGYEQTSFDYRATGLLERVTLPDGSYLEYSYDDAHRLIGMSDSSGNRIAYTLDTAGNRTAEDIYDPSNVLTGTRSRVFDALSRASQEIGAAGTAAVTTALAYDKNGNQTNVNAPLGRNTVQAYDELNRLTQVTDPASGITKYGYNALDQLISVTDPRNKITSYTYNAFGELTQQVSPDTGTTINTHDSAGNLLTSTDARNKTATYSYDALNRVTSVSYPDQTISYDYDGGSNQNGRLTAITDASGSTNWTYDPQGRVLSRQQSTGIVKSVGYAYDLSGQLQTLALPSGNTVTYGYTDGKVTSLVLNGSTTILSNVLYQPFGPTRGWTWGNGAFAVREYDADGLITNIDSAGLKAYGYDEAFRITDITDASDPSLSQSYGYDLLDRLTSATGTAVNQSWTYDANGNRLTQGGSESSTYTVSSTSNRLNGVSGSLARSYAYDDAGNTTSDGTVTFVYNDAGRMVSATKAGVTTTYAHNGLGQRVKKTTAGSSRYFVYDEAGHLLGEYDNAGTLLQETIWLGDTPVATIRPNGGGVNVFYVHADHLNTPRRVTRPSDSVVVWRWDSDPFGTSAANEDPDGDLTLFAYELRFPGQYYDQETGLSYNYYRDAYDPATGRYTQSDPVGLYGGLNTYAYVESDPAGNVDPKGLSSIAAADAAVLGGLCAAACAASSSCKDSVRNILQSLRATPVIDPDKPIHPQLPGYIDPGLTCPTTQSEACPPLREPPSPKDRCVNAVNLRFAACLSGGRNPILCQTQRIFGLVFCTAQSPDSSD